MAAWLDVALAFVEHYGFLGLFLLMFADTAMLLHFVPGLAIIGALVVLVATTPARFALAVADMTLGSMLGTIALYAVFYYGGRPTVDRYRRRLRLKPEHVDRLDRLFHGRAGEAVVFALRFVPLLRVYIAIPAGLARMDWRKYVLYSLPGVLLFNLGLALVSFAAGRAGLVDDVLRAWNALLAGLEVPWIAWTVAVALLLLLLLVAWRSWPHRWGEASGRLVDEKGAPWAGLVVEARRLRRFQEDADTIASTRTDARGAFALAVPRARGEVVVEVRDRAGIRVLWRGAVAAGGEIALPAAEVAGWVTTGGLDAPLRLSQGNAFEALVDGEEAFRRVLHEVESARESLLLLQLYNKPNFIPDLSRGAAAPTLDEALHAASQRGVRVRVLLNGNWLAPDDSRRTARWFRQRRSSVLVRRYPLTPGVAHAKMLVADGERAVLIDPPFEPRWWDTRAHPLRSRLRGPGFPEHNVSCALRGPIVTDLHDVFRGLWDARAAASRDGEAALAPAPRPQPPAGPLAAQLTFTTPRGRRTVLESYQRALLEARRWAYVENQYFTSYNIRAAVRRALDANPRLEVILLLNERPDTPTYPAWQDRRLRELGWPDEPRLGVFSPWQVGSDSMGHVEARPIYVHSKVAIVDDAWATTGSANLDDIALDTAREWGFLDKRSIEVNLAMLDGIAGFPRTGDVARLRRTLWSEHLGEEEAALADEPQGGWLARWRARAQQNLAAIERGEPRIRGYLLPHHARLPRRVRVLGPRTRGA